MSWDFLNVNYDANEDLDQISDFKSFYKEFVSEILLNQFISYSDMITFRSFQVQNLRL